MQGRYAHGASDKRYLPLPCLCHCLCVVLSLSLSLSCPCLRLCLLFSHLVSSRLVLSCPVLLCLVLFCLGRLGGHLAPFLLVLGVVLDRFRLSWEVFWLSWGVLASSWGVLERLGARLGAVDGPKPTNPSPTGGLGSVFGSSWAPKTTPRRVQDGTLAPQDGPRGRQDGAQDE